MLWGVIDGIIHFIIRTSLYYIRILDQRSGSTTNELRFMAIIGNILLAISTLVFLGLNTGSLAKAPPANDGAVSYGWSIIILNLVFIGLMIIVSLIIGFKGGFDWVSSKKSTRFLFVAIGLLSALITSGLGSFFRHEAGPVPFLIKSYSSFAPMLIPAVMIIVGFILLNNTIQNSMPAQAYKWPLVFITILGITGTASAVIGFLQESSRNRVAVAEDRMRFEDSNHQRILAEIDTADVINKLVLILIFTGDNQPDEIRNAAVEKVKTNPHWQEELIRLLQTDWAPEPLQFLASNDVDNQEMFLEPVRQGVMIQARLIHESISRASHPSHLYPEQFSWEVERVLRTVDKFKGKGVDYVPAMKELHASLNGASDVEMPKFTCIGTIEKWLKKNS